MRYVLAKTNENGQKYLYRTYMNTFVFESTPNVFFVTEEQATNFLHHNSTMFDSVGVHVIKWKTGEQ